MHFFLVWLLDVSNSKIFLQRSTGILPDKLDMCFALVDFVSSVLFCFHFYYLRQKISTLELDYKPFFVSLNVTIRAGD